MAAHLRDVESAVRGHDLAYTPAMHVLIQGRVAAEARGYMNKLVAGEELVWDEPPLAAEPWKVYGAISSGVAQAVRLFGREVGFDQWGEMRRLGLTTASWDPLPYRFGWWLACRPFGGVKFADDPVEFNAPLTSLSYLNSWPHGYLLFDEIKRFLPMLKERFIEQALQLQVLHKEEVVSLKRLQRLMIRPDVMGMDDYVDLMSLGTDDDDPATWQFRRTLILLQACAKTHVLQRDLICMGY